MRVLRWEQKREAEKYAAGCVENAAFFLRAHDIGTSFRRIERNTLRDRGFHRGLERMVAHSSFGDCRAAALPTARS
jgi:hypothetical protein